MQKLGIYYRVSTDKQEFASQEHAINLWLKDREGLSIRRFEDYGSGKNDDRPGFLQLLAAAKAKEIDTVVVYRLDRFSRHANTAIRQILQLDEWGVGFVAVSQAALNLGDENPFRRTMLAAFAEIAELERKGIVARVNAGLAAARARGVKLGPPSKLQGREELFAQMKKAGMSTLDMASELNVSRRTIQKWILEK